MTEMGIDLESEIARVRGELVCFRDVCLPAFFAPGGRPRNDPPGYSGHAEPTSQEWAQAADRLLEALPAGGRAGRLDLADFPILRGRTEPSYSVEGGRIAWRCQSLSDVRIELTLRWAGGRTPSTGDPRRDFDERIPEIKEWFLELDVDEAMLWNALCTTLPALVDADPGFVLRAMDPETWRRTVLGDPGLTPERRAAKLSFIDVRLGYYLSNGLLHVLGAAADNQFDLILDLLRQCDLHGAYSGMFPEYILGVLWGKVEALRGLAGVEDVPRGRCRHQRGAGSHEPHGK